MSAAVAMHSQAASDPAGTVGPVAGLPRCSGTYVLVMQARQGFTAAAGCLGRHTLSAGWYLYVGSALGPGGVAARCGRHLKADKAPRWHVDYLEGGASIRELWYLCGGKRLEHEWADVLAGWCAVSGRGKQAPTIC